MKATGKAISKSIHAAYTTMFEAVAELDRLTEKLQYEAKVKYTP